MIEVFLSSWVLTSPHATASGETFRLHKDRPVHLSDAKATRNLCLRVLESDCNFVGSDPSLPTSRSFDADVLTHTQVTQTCRHLEESQPELDPQDLLVNLTELFHDARFRLISWTGNGSSERIRCCCSLAPIGSPAINMDIR